MNNDILSTPLAARMRPARLEEFIGQKHIVSEGKLLYRMIKTDRLSSVIFCGPPGVGKTTLARIISNETRLAFKRLNAVSAGVGDIRDVADSAKVSFENPTGRVVLFFDEIHRLNKNQQDVLLPYVEDGTIILIGATIENPYYAVNRALISRSTVFRFEPLCEDDILQLLHTAASDKEKGLGLLPLNITDEAYRHIAYCADGDARKALTSLELAAMTTEKNASGEIIIDLSVAEECTGARAIKYDTAGENHYDTASAFIKSMRNYMEPDAVLHYLARMIEAGEKPEFIARRIMIAAAEEVGLANPAALQVAVAAAQAVEMVGWPESSLILAEAALMVACSPKSNAAYKGINKALEDVRTKKIGKIPSNLKNTDYEGAVKLSPKEAYKYSHDYPNARAEQQYLPDELRSVRYYYPKRSGSEAKIYERMAQLFSEDYLKEKD
ncbi:MAG: replication-associated recombination protein A [Clostridiales bacterium]|nr:replication-associated recombination protein A [Clostridiales bacterium]